MRLITLVTLLVLFSKPLFAKSMEDFWDSLGGVSNISNPRFVKGQKAGHLSLGSVQMRSKVQNAQLASLRLPSMSAGCGGIDFYAGGFSFISSDQLVALMKSIGSNAPGALAQLAIDNISPKIGSIIKYFQNVARNINQLNINSCETSRNLVGAVFGDYEGVKNQGCKLAGNFANAFKDGAGAFEACGSGGKATSTLRNAPKSIKDQFPAGDLNIAWKALRDSGLLEFNSDEGVQIAELLMSLSGTIIIIDAPNDSAEPQFYNKFPKIEDDSTISALLEGGKFTGFSCLEKEKCVLMDDTKTYKITKDQSYLGKVSKALDEIAQAMKNDDDSNLSDGTYKLLSFSSLPIYNILRVNESYFKDNNTETGSISEFLALDILYGYLQEVNLLVRKAASKYDNKSYNKIFKTFFQNQREIKKSLRAKRDTLSKKFADQIRIIERTAKVEKMLRQSGQGNIKFGMN